MASILEIFPEVLLDRRHKDDFILMLQQLPVPPRRKKELLIEWCRYVGVALTRDMVEQLLGPQAEKGRG